MDTAKIDKDKAILLMEGAKWTRDMLFFLMRMTNTGASTSKHATNGNPSPTKSKIIGRNVLQNKICSAAHEEVITSAVEKVAENQRELHACLQEEGFDQIFRRKWRELVAKRGKVGREF